MCQYCPWLSTSLVQQTGQVMRARDYKQATDLTFDLVDQAGMLAKHVLPHKFLTDE